MEALTCVDTLHLTLKKEWFNKILSGEKKIEYREVKPYWTKRFFRENGEARKYKIVIFKNGYGRNVPTMKVEFASLTIKDKYEIHLGKIFEVRNLH